MTDALPAPTSRAARLAALLLVAGLMLGAWRAGLLGAFSLRDARATPRPTVARRYLTARLAAAETLRAPETAPPGEGRFAATPVE